MQGEERVDAAKPDMDFHRTAKTVGARTAYVDPSVGLTLTERVTAQARNAPPPRHSR